MMPPRSPQRDWLSVEIVAGSWLYFRSNSRELFHILKPHLYTIASPSNADFGLVPDEIHLVQIEDLLLGTYIEFKAGIHFSFSVVRIELCVSTRLFANL